MSATPRYTVPFGELSAADVATVGGKSASLGELTSAGVAVPEGFSVTTAAFDAFITAVDPDAEIRDAVVALGDADTGAVETTARSLRERITGQPVPDAIRDAVSDAMAGAFGADSDDPVAVRSSATCEDSEDASFAGLQDTYLWVRGVDAVIHSMRACWASIYNAESITYRRRLDLAEADIRMAVAVQRMVDAECAGVMFTRSPTTGDRSVVVIEGSWGLGSCLVSGEVTPDRFVINKVTGEIAKRDVSSKTLEHVPDTEGSGILERAVDAERRDRPVLDDERLAELWTIARRVEKHYGAPQDIEWAVSKADGGSDPRVYLLQSRPETVWAAREQAPAAKPQAKAFDHVLGAMSRRKP